MNSYLPEVLFDCQWQPGQTRKGLPLPELEFAAFFVLLSGIVSLFPFEIGATPIYIPPFSIPVQHSNRNDSRGRSVSYPKTTGVSPKFEGVQSETAI